MTKQRIIVGITGATGFVYGVHALKLLKKLNVESHLVITKPAELTREYETDFSREEVRDLADVNYAISDIGSAISSGSFKTLGMLIAPCSVRTLGEIASCVSSNLLTRAADVVLKERRRLVLMLRETPLHTGHIKQMLAVSEMGGIVMPPVPAFYDKPKSLDDMVHHSVVRALDLFGLDVTGFPRWGEDIKP
ncbi:UbiX family flavin prenyltransferase [Entomomonas sp. E2T0]|uniref:UbiX family flavin prenyltransferase n=1 Tax=Entomomonas sp. E2T0 TaxID=2930213 RepID=UPI0022285119|nr:UbiX family flavin prenyltransferase [Entomomonas sp. E2T0]UYZ84826.1 UbiX family flavin prenyltransferase [Entomomonas sp. E2T0]